MFVFAMKKILINDYIRNDKRIRYVLKKRTIIKISEDFALNENPKQINFKAFKSYEINMIK